jgi:hypothetical protein
VKQSKKRPTDTAAYEDTNEEVAAMAAKLHEYYPERREAILRRICMKRDDSRCVLSGVYDLGRLAQLDPEERARIQMTSYVHPAYIIKPALSRSGGKGHQVRSVKLCAHRL